MQVRVLYLVSTCRQTGKGLNVLANIQGTGRRQTYMSAVAMGKEGERRLDFTYQLDTWSPTNTDATFPRPGNTSLNENNNYVDSDFGLAIQIMCV